MVLQPLEGVSCQYFMPDVSKPLLKRRFSGGLASAGAGALATACVSAVTVRIPTVVSVETVFQTVVKVVDTALDVRVFGQVNICKGGEFIGEELTCVRVLVLLATVTLKVAAGTLIQEHADVIREAGNVVPYVMQ